MPPLFRIESFCSLVQIQPSLTASARLSHVVGHHEDSDQLLIQNPKLSAKSARTNIDVHSEISAQTVNSYLVK